MAGRWRHHSAYLSNENRDLAWDLRLTGGLLVCCAGYEGGGLSFLPFIKDRNYRI